MSHAIERIEPGTIWWDAYYGNHYSRYDFASRLLADQPGEGPLLDAACGVGYGSNLLAARLGRRVVAVDRDEKALRLARTHFAHDRVTFLRDDCQTLAQSGEGAPYAAVVSFETLEHLKRPLEFLRTCRGILASRGTLLVSTPNSRVSSPGGRTTWEYHEREYTAVELLALLEDAGFVDVSLFGQRLTETGKLRAEMRGELHALASNPFIRAGRWLQRMRGHRFGPLLPERVSDFEIVPVPDANAADALGAQGPFVYVAQARPG